MTGKEKIQRNTGLTFDLLRQWVDNPKELSKISDGILIEFIDKDSPIIQKKARD